MNGINVDINHLKKGEVSLGTSMYVGRFENVIAKKVY